ncbi:YnfU family zinc-binding protein [Enterobacter sp. CC120223-11]|uniref:YnfU family zinc-binding protein n=1 Tax=Enterobacter sp. CC120223-11 TaxID=1378073 RepID=UPI001C3EC753|nr:YnfU family zinc-binding protein [Enterobacter sp. CC120223-11]
MPIRKDKNTRRNHLTKCASPSCAKESEHSASRIQKGSQLICPHCGKLFQSTLQFVR